MTKEQELRQAVVEYGKRLVETGLVQGTWGNIAVRLDDNYMLVTPSGLDYLHLTPDDVVKVNLENLEYDGARKPTSEKKMHRAILNARPDAMAVIHTHSVDCGVFAAAGVSLPAATEKMKTLVGGEMRCAPHALPSTGRLSDVAVKALDGRNGCLLQNHGVICCGKDLANAFAICEAAEEAAGKYLEEHV
ncbi:MAG: class II aldolase/adducin family protein [Oscillospiraceae bacterium]